MSAVHPYLSPATVMPAKVAPFHLAPEISLSMARAIIDAGESLRADGSVATDDFRQRLTDALWTVRGVARVNRNIADAAAWKRKVQWRSYSEGE